MLHGHGAERDAVASILKTSKHQGLPDSVPSESRRKSPSPLPLHYDLPRATKATLTSASSPRHAQMRMGMPPSVCPAAPLQRKPTPPRSTPHAPGLRSSHDTRPPARRIIRQDAQADTHTRTHTHTHTHTYCRHGCARMHAHVRPASCPRNVCSPTRAAERTRVLTACGR